MSDAAPGTLDEGQLSVELPPVDPVAAPPPADAKPRRTRRPKADTAPKPTRTTRSKTPPLAPRLTTGLVTIGTLVGMLNEFDGLAICNGAAPFAEALSKAADENPKLRDALERMLTVGTMGGVIAAGAAIGVPIAANHGLIPRSIGSLFGAEPPPRPEKTADATKP